MRADAVARQAAQAARRAAEIVVDSRAGQDSDAAPVARRLAAVVKAAAEATVQDPTLAATAVVSVVASAATEVAELGSGLDPVVEPESTMTARLDAALV